MPRQANRKRRADGNYQRSITVGRRPDGKPVRKTLYAKTLKELDELAAEFERKLKHGTLSSNDKMSFGELAELWLKDYKPTIGVNTRKMYRSLLDNHLLPELSMIKLRDLKPHSLQAIINHLAENETSESTLKKIKLTACQVLDVAMKNDIIFRNVFTNVEIPPIEAEERRPLTQEEINLITSTYNGHKFGIPALIALYTGVRRGELLSLTWGDVDLKNKLLTVNKAAYFDGNRAYIKKPKTKSGTRLIPIPDFLIPILRGRRAASLMVCPSASGEMMTQSAFKSAWHSYLHYLNIVSGGKDASRSRPKLQVIDEITLHMLRHTYCSMLHTAGIDAKTAQKFMGHADLSTTLKIYTHLSEQKEQQAIGALNEHLASIISDAVKMQ